MKTFFIDLDSVSSEAFREVLGYVLTVGFKFRKIDLVKDSLTSRVLVVETETRTEEKAFKEFLKKNEIVEPIAVLNNRKAVVGLKTIGNFKQLEKNETANIFYLDKTNGKRFIITK
jgi:hypothetical protein